MRYKELYIQRRLNGERNFRKERTVFDYYETEALLGEEKAREVERIYQSKAFTQSEDEQPEQECDITCIQIEIALLDDELLALRKELLAQASDVSGDDDVFDYFPDLVYAFEQICYLLDRTEVYEQTAKQLREIYKRYTDEILF